MPESEPEQEYLRDDGRCLQCGGPRAHAVWNKYGQGQAVSDPFCSAACCRVFHKVEGAKERPKGPGKTPAVCGSARAYKEGCKCDRCRGYMAAATRRRRDRERARAAAEAVS